MTHRKTEKTRGRRPSDPAEGGEEARGAPADRAASAGGVGAVGESPEVGSAVDADAGAGEDDRPFAGSPEEDEEYAAEAALGRQLDVLQSEFESLNDRHLRLAAEFKNYRRRAEGEMGEAWGRAQADLVRRFLDVFDDLQRVSGLDPAGGAVSVEAIVEGVDLVERKFARALEEAGVTVVDPVGEAFDPEVMEAVLRVPAASREEGDRVAQVFQKGYLLKGHLIRPARVSVSMHE